MAAAAEQGCSSELCLPTGTGKTLISHLVALRWLERNPASQVLLVVPRRALALQHNRSAAWAREYLNVLVVTGTEVANLVRLGPKAERAALLIGLPGLLATCFSTRAIPDSVVRRIGLIIIDEFDEFLHQEYTRTGITVRFDIDFAKLRALFRKDIPVVLMSGTSPTAARGSEAQRLTAFMEREYKPKRVKIAVADYAAFVPKIRLVIESIDDPEVASLDEAIGTDLMFAMNDLNDAVQAVVDEDWLFPRLPLVTGRQIRTLRLANGAFVPATEGARQACCKLLASINRSLFLQEDMLAGYESGFEEFFFQPWNSDELKKLARQKFVRRPERPEYYPAPRGKFSRAIGLATQRGAAPGVIFVRHIRLAECLCNAKELRHLNPVTLHGDMRPEDQDAAAQALGARSRLLILVRETGKRGLDLPQAAYAIFFSARSSEVGSWQEFSRIRSTASFTKEIHLLCYEGTRETKRLSQLLVEIRNSGREYEICVPHSNREDKIRRPNPDIRLAPKKFRNFGK